MRKKLLIVDDDELVLYGLARALRSESVDVVAVANATDAQEQIAACSFDLCLVDIHLPDLCGIELMKQIKASCPQIKCIIMTASFRDKHEYTERMRQVAEITGCHFLPKPFDLNYMRDLVLVALKREDFSCSLEDQPNLSSSSWKKRIFVRQPYTEEIIVKVRELGGGELEGYTIQAVTRDISDDGIGILSDFVLSADQILLFPEKLANRQGRVVWSRSDNQGKCQAGIRFA